jgi:histidyl-tRNA synthetase
MTTDAIKGFKDFVGEQAERRQKIKGILASIFRKYGFELVETPVIEYEEFVKGTNTGDEAVSDIFRLKDKGNRNLALRYEFTFQLKRLMKNMKLPFKRYQIGEVFRDEPVSANRARQFVQCDVDVVGSKTKDEAELLCLAKEVFDMLGIKVKIYFNNRKLLNEILDKEGIKDKEKVIREIDKLDKLSESDVKRNLKKYNAEKALGIFKKPESYFEKYSSYSEIKELEKYLKFFGVKAEFLPSLARGLSYYNGSVFEVKTTEFKETITGGGSYIFNGIQCTGISFGIDRLEPLSEIPMTKNKYLVISLEQDKEAIALVKKLREQDKITEIFYGKPSKALEYANSYGINSVIFIGDKEIKAKKFMVKDMKTGKETRLGI